MRDSEFESETGLVDELKQLGDDARTYAEAEWAFQRARAELVGGAVKTVALLGLLAFVVAVFALVALVAGLLIGLTGIVGPWWATAIITGGLLLVAGGALAIARKRWRAALREAFDAEHAE